MILHEKKRKFVKDHLAKRGNKSIEVTERHVRNWWGVLNIAVFYGKLNKPKIVTVRKLKGCWGTADDFKISREEHKRGVRYVNIEIHHEFVSRKMFLDTLVHEMVHAWEYQFHTVMGHGKRFFAWKDRIKRTVSLDLDNGQSVEEYIDG